MKAKEQPMGDGEREQPFLKAESCELRARGQLLICRRIETAKGLGFLKAAKWILARYGRMVQRYGKDGEA